MKQKEVLERLEEYALSDPDFTKEERDTLRQIIEAYRGWSALGKATKGLIAFLVLVAGGLTAWNVVTGALKTWLTR